MPWNRAELSPQEGVVMKRLGIILVAVCCDGFAFAADKGEFWTSKPYQNWSAKECKKLLEDSPWSKKITLRKTNLSQTNRQTGAERTATSPRGAADPLAASNP